MRNWSWVAIATLMAFSVLATAQTPLEIDILEGYLQEHDIASDLPHCGRHDGTMFSPAGPVTVPGGATNDILRQHKDWHLEVEGPPGSQTDTDDSNRFGDYFVYWHREFIGEYETWRDANGHPPLPAWDPSTPIPSDFSYEFPGRGCSEGRNEDPGVPLPTWATTAGGAQPDPLFGHTALCDFQDINQFGKALAREYHPAVHRSLGGDMAGGQGPRDPIFWAYHQFLDDIAVELEQQCRGTADSGARGIPSGGSIPVILAVGIASVLVGKKRSLYP